MRRILCTSLLVAVLGTTKLSAQVDVLPPVITYTQLIYTCSVSDRTFPVTITDDLGIPTAGPLQPRVYFRKNAGPYFSSQGVLTSGTGTNGIWNFTIVSSLMGGIAVGDNITYYVIAQDIGGPNITSNAAGVVATDVNNVTSPPPLPYSYGVSTTLGGLYTVGVGGDFTTLTSAVAAYNVACLTAPVIFSLTDANYPSETFPISVNANPYASAINTLTIKPAAGVSPTLSGTNTNAVLILNGADYVTIDGSNGNTVNSICPRVQATRDLTIVNTNTGGTAAVVWFQTSTGADPATNNRIMNTNVTGSGTTTGGTGIAISGTSPGSGAGANMNNNNQIVNNAIRRTGLGIFCAGASAAVRNSNNTISLNDLNFAGLNALGRVGIMVLNENGTNILSNNIGNITNTGTQDVLGISVGINNAGSSNTIGADVINATIAGNVLNDLTQSNTYSAVGINIGGAPSGTINVTNNIINRVHSNGTAGDFGCGIFYGGGAGALNIHHNTIVMDGPVLASGTQATLGIGINGTTPTVNIRNNIIVAQGVTGANLNTGIALGYTSTVGNYLNLTSNYNDIRVTGTGSAVGMTGGLNTGTRRITLANWTAETGRDVNSTIATPTFVSASNLHMVAGSNPGIEDAGTPILTVPVDIDCQPRNNCLPDMGADEFGAGPREINVTGNSVTIVDGDATPSLADHTDFGTMSVCNGTVVRTFTIQNTGGSSLAVSAVNITGAAAGDYTITIPPSSTVVAFGSTTFEVTFNPTTSGTRAATINIINNDCDELTYDFAITGNGTQILATAASQTNVLCNGGNTGSASVNVAGGMPTIVYAWTPSGGNASSASGLAAGTYSCTVTDANGCTSEVVFTITEPTVLTASVSSQTNVTCNGGSDGSATVTASGGTGAPSYSWTPSGGNAATASGLSANTYTCTVTDANGCTNAVTVTITEPPAITSSISSQTNVSCNGGSDGSATVSVSGGTPGYTYSWSPSGGNAATATGLSAGNYTCTITDANSCVHTQTVAITAPSTLVASVASQSNVSCNGGSNGAASVTVTGGTAAYSYDWTPGNPTGDGTASVTGLSPGTWTCTVTDANSCVTSQTFTITAPTALVASASSQTNASCNGGSDGTASVTVSGGTTAYSYNWTPGNPTGDGTASVSGLTAGTWTCTVTDANSCVTTQTFNITSPSALVALPASQTNISCNGGSNGAASVAVTGGTAAYTYDWTPGNPTGDGTASVTGLAAGTWTCTVTDANSCVTTQTFNITAPSALASTVSSQTNVSCNGGTNGSVTVSVSGGTPGYAYAWLPSGGNSATASGLSAGTYTCTITDANGCTRTQTATVTQPPAITSSVSSQTNASCNGGSNGSATVAASGGTPAYTYSWAPTGGTAATATGLSSGTYTCTITDANGCTIQQTVSITQPSAITSSISSQTNVSCNGGTNGSATVAASGGTGALTYSWAPTGGTAPTASGLAAGTYTCTITDANGCTRAQTVTITQPPAISSIVSSQTNVSCNGGSNGSATISAAGGTGSLTYNWLPSGGTGTSASGLSAGVYTVTITDANNCTSTQTVNITQAPAITSTVTSTTDATCGNNNGSATVSASGGTGSFTYSWAPTGGTAATASGLGAGSYTVTITDASGCTHTQVATINNMNGPTVTVTSSTNVTCNGGNDGSATVNVTGGTGIITYDWTPGNPTGDGTVTVTGLTQGVWTCTVSDQNGCIGTQTVNITEPSMISSFVSSQSNVSCNGGNNGSATVTSSGGTGAHTYVWSSGSTTASESGLAVGTYTVTITDANGCTRTQLVNITQPTVVTANITSSTNVSCFGGNDGSATTTASGGTGSLSYSWTPSGGINPTASGLTQGSYTCTVTDVNGCTGSASVVITQPAQITVNANVTATTVCAGTPVTFTGSGTTATYAWSGGVTDGVPFTPTTTDTYTITGTDASGCTNTATVTVVVNTLPSVSANASAVVVCTGTPVTFTGSGTATSYTWSGGVTDGVPFTMTTSDTYTVTGTDANGCSASATISVTVNPVPTVALGPDQALCSGSVTLDAQNAGATYLWNDNSTAQTLLVSATGIYWVDVTNSSGCSARDSVSITINSNPTVTLGADTSVCATSITLDAQNAGASYLWNDNSTNQTLIATTSGTYFVTATFVGGCFASDTITVTINTPPTVVFSMPLDTMCDQDASITLTGSPASGTFTGPGVSGNTFDPATLSGVQTISYTYTDVNGCSGTAIDSVLVDICLDGNVAEVTFGMNIYPNPNYGHFYIELNYVPTEVVTIEVTNSLGQVVKLVETTSTITELDIEMFEGGVYNVRVIEGGTIFTGRVVKE